MGGDIEQAIAAAALVTTPVTTEPPDTGAERRQRPLRMVKEADEMPRQEPAYDPKAVI
jgi:hypothetical protein